MPRSVPRDEQREQRADARRGQRGEDRHRMDVALVEHAEHDVHRHHGGEDQQQRVAERGAEGERRALEARAHARRQADLGFGRTRSPPPRAERRAGREVERDRRRRELAEVVDRERGGPLDDLRDVPSAPAGRWARGRGARRARPAPRRNSGFTSSTTRYWFDCVKMVEISRWPRLRWRMSSTAGWWVMPAARRRRRGSPMSTDPARAAGRPAWLLDRN